MSSGKILVTGLAKVPGASQEAILEKLVLHIESKRHCPDGGEVNEEESSMRDNNSAVITFYEMSVAEKLASRGTLVLSNVTLTLTLYSEELENRSRNKENNTPVHDNTVRDMHEKFSSPDIRGTTYDLPSDITQDLPLPDKNKPVSSLPHSLQSSVFGSFDDEDDTDKQEKKEEEKERLGNSAAGGFYVAGEKGSNRSADNVVEKPTVTQSSSVDNIKKIKTNSSACDNTANENIVPVKQEEIDEKIIKLADAAKYKLLYRASKYGRCGLTADVASKLTFNQEKQEISIKDSRDKIGTLVDKVYEIITNAIHRRIPESCGFFTNSEQGQQIINKLLTENKMAAVAFSQSENVHVLCENEKTFEEVLAVFRQNMIVESISVEDKCMKYTESKLYQSDMKQVLGSSNVSVSQSESKKEIMVCGLKTEMKGIVESIKKLLEENKEIETKIKAECPVVKLLEMHDKESISKDIENGDAEETSAVAVTFQTDGDPCVVLSGFKKDVERANDILNKKYIQTVKSDKYDVTKSGFRVEKFHTEGEYEHTCIIKWQQKKKCYIEVEEIPVHEISPIKPQIDKDNTSEANKKSDSYRAQLGGLLKKGGSVLSSLGKSVASIIPSASGAAAASNTDDSSKEPAINLVKGSIVEFKDADVLVNSIASKSSHLSKCGVVASGFHKAGGEELQQELQKVGFPKQFGSDISVTSATGKLTAKKIFHIAIRSRRNEKSDQLLKSCIIQCLKKAVEEKMTSIAFSTLGCGKLGYDSDFVAETFVKSVNEVKPNIKVYVVCFSDDLYEIFEDALDSSTSIDDTSDTSEDEDPISLPVPSPAPVRMGAQEIAACRTLVCRTLSFQIYAHDSQTVTEVQGKIAKFFQEKTAEKKVPLLTKWDEMGVQYQRSIIYLSHLDAEVYFDEKQNSVIIKGSNKELVGEKKTKVQQILKEEEAHGGLQRIKNTKGVKDYFKALGKYSNDSSPAHWQQIKSLSSNENPQMTTLDPQSELYKYIYDMVMGTWDQSVVGTGADAKGLSHKNIKINKISAIENPEQYKKFIGQKKLFCERASQYDIPSVKGMNGKPDILTASTTYTAEETNELNKLIPEINEYHLLHGSAFVEEIRNKGIDFRFAGDKVMYGKGAYFAESSTKADQYADNRDARSPVGQTLHMFVVRVLLGVPHVAKEPYFFKKPPCNEPSCKKMDNCTKHPDCHSVIATKRWNDKAHRTPGSPTSDLLFREFIVYEIAQCYPEFDVEYGILLLIYRLLEKDLLIKSKNALKLKKQIFINKLVECVLKIASYYDGKG